jgi:hypothetical protein
MSLLNRLLQRISGQSRRYRARRHTAYSQFGIQAAQVQVLENRRLLSALTVTTAADSGAGSLRAEIAAAKSGDSINFASSLKGKTIWLASELVIRANMTIEGPGAGLLAISGSSKCRVFEVDWGQVTLSGLTIENGESLFSDHEGAGGGIYNTGTLTVSGCTITTNNTAYNSTALAGQTGGGIFNHGILSVTGSTLSGNRSGFGGGIDNVGTLTVSGCTLSGNSAIGAGGGIANGVGSGHGTATLTNCTFSNNSAGGGGGGGMAVSNGGIASVKATLTNCTFSNNSARSSGVGGALNVTGSATLTNCTLSLNSASTGGGIWVNPGYPGAILNLTNTIVAGNTAGTGPDIYGAVATADHNLVGDARGSTGIVNGANGNIVGGNGHPVINADLGPLQNNGGPTETMALLAGSPAVGHADNSKATATDQRGVTRVDEPGETTDIGAFEL